MARAYDIDVASTRETVKGVPLPVSWKVDKNVL